MKQFRADESPILSLRLPDNTEGLVIKAKIFRAGIPYQEFEILNGPSGYYSKKIGALPKGTYQVTYEVFKSNGRKDGKYGSSEETIIITAIIDNDKLHNDVMGNIDYGESQTI